MWFDKSKLTLPAPGEALPGRAERMPVPERHFVSGAQVSVLNIPFGRIAPAPTLTSDSQGYVTFNLNPTSKMPLIKGYLITAQVRAVVPSTNILAGPTGYRLTSVRINPF